MNCTTFKVNLSKERINCWFCGRDLSKAWAVKYVDEGPVCSICVARHALNAWSESVQSKKAPANKGLTEAQTREGGLL
jgi:hypothetical protein